MSYTKNRYFLREFAKPAGAVCYTLAAVALLAPWFYVTSLFCREDALYHRSKDEPNRVSPDFLLAATALYLLGTFGTFWLGCTAGNALCSRDNTRNDEALGDEEMAIRKLR